MYGIGSIISIEYQIFNNGYKNSKYEIDHCKKRPAVVIAEDEKNFYYLTLTGTKGKSYRQYEIDYQKKSYITLDNIYSKKIYGAVEKNRLSNKELLMLLIKFYKLHNSMKQKKPMFKRIEKIVLNEIKILSLEMQKSHRK